MEDDACECKVGKCSEGCLEVVDSVSRFSKDLRRSAEERNAMPACAGTDLSGETAPKSIALAGLTWERREARRTNCPTHDANLPE